MKKRSISVYAAGGAAANICKLLEPFNEPNNKGFADLNIFYVDASKSNLGVNDRDNAFILEGKDGSGKIRKSNYSHFEEHVPEILLKFPPGDLNVVVHSTGGGSGSVAGPLIVNELLSQGKLVVVMMIGSFSTKIEAVNTRNTVVGYDNRAKELHKPIVAVYEENNSEVSRTEVNNKIYQAIIFLAAVFSGENEGLDSSDLNNFINYNSVTAYPVRLCLLAFFQNEIQLNKNERLLTALSLSDSLNSTDASVPIEYQATGALNTDCRETLKIRLPFHSCVIYGHYAPIIERLEHSIAEYDKLAATVVDKPLSSIAVDKTTSTGLIL